MSNANTGSQGSAYGCAPQHSNKLLTEVGPGRPCGEMMRRYWHPIAASAELTSVRPKQLRILGEDLVLFRDGSGKPGLLYSRCMHRGTSLFFGREWSLWLLGFVIFLELSRCCGQAKL